MSLFSEISFVQILYILPQKAFRVLVLQANYQNQTKTFGERSFCNLWMASLTFQGQRDLKMQN